jgi:hypothetical protein
VARALANFDSRLSDCSGTEHKYFDTAWGQGQKSSWGQRERRFRAIVLQFKQNMCSDIGQNWHRDQQHGLAMSNVGI